MTYAVSNLMKINSFLPAVKNLPISWAKQQKDGKL